MKGGMQAVGDAENLPPLPPHPLKTTAVGVCEYGNFSFPSVFYIFPCLHGSVPFD